MQLVQLAEESLLLQEMTHLEVISVYGESESQALYNKPGVSDCVFSLLSMLG
jgi:hypothetical protein